MTVLVLGARGAVGRQVVDGLRAAGIPVRASVRDLAKADFPPDVDVVQADLTQPETLAPPWTASVRSSRTPNPRVRPVSPKPPRLPGSNGSCCCRRAASWSRGRRRTRSPSSTG
ncbi:SDR family oxidoreductase [Kribbella sandramycini]|uniref:SDR family oxidoreductase n=1 Tax=Kribbella sandramycini TaxID=60450 RepID=UPI00192E18A9|nr:NAD(P)H-binding protein [Kribbella sandramycini]